MKDKAQIDSLNLLIVVVNRHQGHNVVKVLNDNKIATHINCIGHGTAESGIADLFGFGIIERDIVLSIVPTDMSEKILDELNNDFHFDEPHKGLALTVPISSVEKKILNFIKF